MGWLDEQQAEGGGWLDHHRKLRRGLKKLVPPHVGIHSSYNPTEGLEVDAHNLFKDGKTQGQISFDKDKVEGAIGYNAGPMYAGARVGYHKEGPQKVIPSLFLGTAPRVNLISQDNAVDGIPYIGGQASLEYPFSKSSDYNKAPINLYGNLHAGYDLRLQPKKRQRSHVLNFEAGIEGSPRKFGTADTNYNGAYPGEGMHPYASIGYHFGTNKFRSKNPAHGFALGGVVGDPTKPWSPTNLDGYKITNDVNQAQNSWDIPIRNALEFTKGWLNSPQYKEMLNDSVKASGNLTTYNNEITDANSISQDRQNNFNITDVRQIPEEWYGVWGWGIGGNSEPIKDGRRTINIVTDLPDMDISDTTAHELSHATDDNGNLIPMSDSNKISGYYNDDYKRGLFNKNRYKNDEDYNRYVAGATETRARLNTIRYQGKTQGVYDPYTEKINRRQLNKIKDDTNWSPLNQLKDVYKTRHIVDMMNSISQTTPQSNIPIAKMGGTIPQYVLGGNTDDPTKPITPQYKWSSLNDNQSLDKLETGNYSTTKTGEPLQAKTFPAAYKEAKLQGSKNFVWQGKTYNTDYAGTPKQEVQSYGVNGIKISSKDNYPTAQINKYPIFSKRMLPGHIASTVEPLYDGNFAEVIDYWPSGNSSRNINKFNNGVPSDKYYVYNSDNNLDNYLNTTEKLWAEQFDQKADTMLSDDKSKYNLLFNNCADKTCEGFNVLKSNFITTPGAALKRVQDKYPTLNVTGRTPNDYRNKYRVQLSLANQGKIDDVLKDADNFIAIYGNQDEHIKGTSIKPIQIALNKAGYSLPNSTMKDGEFDGVYGPETEAALKDWKIKNSTPQFKNGGTVTNNWLDDLQDGVNGGGESGVINKQDVPQIFPTGWKPQFKDNTQNKIEIKAPTVSNPMVSESTGTPKPFDKVATGESVTDYKNAAAAAVAYKKFIESQGTVKPTVDPINPNNAWMLGAGNVPAGTSKEGQKFIVNNNLAVQSTGLLGSGVVRALANPYVNAALNTGFFLHGVNSIPNTYRNWVAAADPNNETTWGDALGTTALNALDFWGTGQVLKQGSRLYNTVATGQSALPIAWKSQAVGLSQEASQKMFNSLVNSGKLTDAERAIVADYQYNSRLYTGRNGNVDPIKKQAITDIVKKYNINVGDDAIATRMFNPENNSLGATLENGRLNFGDRPTSFTIGARGRYGSGATDRIVIPNRYLKKMGDKFVKNTYEPLSEDALKLVSEDFRDWAAGIGRDNMRLGQERELIGSGLDFKRIGKVKNDIGGHDWIVRPSKQVPKQLPGSPNVVSSVDDVAINLESQIANLKQQEVLAEKSRKALWADYKAGKISAEEYTSLYKELNPNKLLNSKVELETILREYKVKQDIANTSQQNILKSEEQLGKNIAEAGISNKGVFELGDKYVAKLSAHGYDDASLLVKYSDKIKSPRIAKTLQVKELNGKVYQVQEKVIGTPVERLTETELQNIPKEHIDNFLKDKAELEKLDLYIDFDNANSNMLYNSKKGFQFIDLGISPVGNNMMASNEVFAQTYKGLKLPGSPNVDFSKYLTQEEAVAARAKRMLSQENKWVDQPSTLKGKFETAVENHNPASDYSPEKLGSNTGISTQISKLANLSDANKARVAAHETGHYYRPKIEEGDVWNSFFDWSKLKGKTAESTARDIRKSKEYLSGKGYSKRNSSQYGDEIRERAAQLKDYIAQKNGIPLNQDFKITQAQLDDAIENYVKDTGLDNNMSQMLGALTDKKGLLKTMNKYALGIVPAVGVGVGVRALQQKKQGGTITNNWLDKIQ